MYPGFLACGHGDPFFGGDFDELVNNVRAYAYARHYGIGWLRDCATCEETAALMPGALPFVSPKDDPAPWYDELNPDSAGFFGVVGLDVEGSESSTLQSTVSMGLTGGGIIGPAYYGPRTLTMRGLLIAADECSLQFGLNWVRDLCNTTSDSCVGDSLTFFDCCPCVCDDDTPQGPCWAVNYLEFKTQPSCVGELRWIDTYAQFKGPTPDPILWPNWPANYGQARGVGPPLAQCWPDNYAQAITGPVDCPAVGVGIWWPDTYAQVIVGPPDDSVWCAWPRIYLRLKTGPTSWSCCADECIVPYLRQYHHVRVTEGPTVLRHPSMFSCGAMAEIELVLVAADPTERTMFDDAGAFEFTAAELVDESPPMVMAFAAAPADPFELPGVTTMRGLALLAQPTTMAAMEAPTSTVWSRSSYEVAGPSYGSVLSTQAPVITLRSFDEAADEVRVGVWMGGERLGGWYLPFVPAEAVVTLDVTRRQLYATVNGSERTLATFVRDWEGGPAQFPRLPHGPLTVTVDQVPDRAVRLLTAVATASVGAGG